MSAATIAAMRDVAETHILPRYQKLAEGDVRSKTRPGDLVTIADVESEHALTRILPGLLPGSCVIGEEAVSANDAELKRLEGDGPVWIVDPIDGTANFVEGNARFAVMIALVRRGETLMGWIHDPVANRTLWAEKGAGAWLEERGPSGAPSPPLRVHVALPLSDSFAELTAGLYNREMAGLEGKFARVVRLGSAAHDYWSLTDGRMDVLCFRRLKPWDHAAGLLIHEEAGGYNRLLSGLAYSSAVRDQSGILCAPNRKIWQAILAAHTLRGNS
ncbi:MAG: inositol monophosphatase [Rhodospirillaceae bacterium]|nr:inositol monophosphatase [Rhodospirillaceae bacterium]